MYFVFAINSSNTSFRYIWFLSMPLNCLQVLQLTGESLNICREDIIFVFLAVCNSNSSFLVLESAIPSTALRSSCLGLEIEKKSIKIFEFMELHFCKLFYQFFTILKTSILIILLVSLCNMYNLI